MTYAVAFGRAAAFLLCWESSSPACDYLTHKIKTAGPGVILELIFVVIAHMANGS